MASVVRLTPQEQYQIAVDELRGAQRRVQQPNAAALTGLLATDPGMNRAARAVYEQQQNTDMERALARTIEGWARGRQSADENAALQQTLAEMRTRRMLDQRAYGRESTRIADERRHENRMREIVAQNEGRAAGRSGRGGLRTSEVKEIAGFRESLRELTDLQNTLKDDYAAALFPKHGTWENQLYMHGGAAGRFLADVFGTEGEPGPQADWWTKFNQIVTLPTRHEIFGATLTAGERESWRQASVDADSPIQSIKDQIQWRIDKVNAKMSDYQELTSRGWTSDEATAYLRTGGTAADAPDVVSQTTTESGPGGEVTTTEASGPEGDIVVIDGVEFDLKGMSREDVYQLLVDQYGQAEADEMMREAGGG